MSAAVHEKTYTVSVSQTRETIAPFVHQTAVDVVDTVGYGNTLFAKLESEQVTGSFKARGAAAKVLQLCNTGWTEFMTVSAGNHAAGVAHAVSTMNRVYGTRLLANIYVPEGTPNSKKDNILQIGGEAVRLYVCGQSFDETLDIAFRQNRRRMYKKELAYIAPFDSHTVMLGQATAVAEALEQAPDTDRLFVPVGGGGLLAGSLLAVEESGLGVKVVGVQYCGNISLEHSLAMGKAEELEYVDSLAEGTAVRKVGRGCLDVILRHRNSLETVVVEAKDVGREISLEIGRRQVTVSDYGHDAAFEHFPETTGFVALAGARVYAENHHEVSEENMLALVTGSNSDSYKESAMLDAWQSSRSQK